MGTEMKWTPEQQNVIDFRNRNILVSAAAGSGKTAVLVERIIQRITDSENPLDIDRLLVVTFTKAAAAEMRERIGNAIEKCLEENPEDDNLRKQSTLIHNAQITTIDSFCLFVVRNHFEEIHLDPNFRIADQGEIKLLEMDALNDLFEQEYAKGNDAFLRLVDAYSDKRSNKAVKDMVSKIYHQSSSSPWPKEWIAELVAPYQVNSVEELLATPMMQGIFTYVKTLLTEMQLKLFDLRKLAVETEGLQKYVDMLDKDIELFTDITAVENYLDLEAFCKKIEFARAATITRFDGDENKKEAVSKGRAAIREEVKELKERYFALSLEQLVEQLRSMRDHANELVRLALLYVEAMDAKKEEKHIMDFSDVEHAALRIFVDEETKELTATALDFKKHFDEIMIDEYQDSNQVQEDIMRAISGESEGRFNMFMVGDVKQSIYRFRLARPELFMEKFATYDVTESSKQRIDLHKNFRSRNEVLDFTNDIFYKIMDSDLGNVIYDEEAALYCGAEYESTEGMEAEVLLYEKEYDIYEEYEADALSTRQLEARMIASRIQELKETLQVTDKETRKLRPLRNSDIVILLRSIQGWGNDFVSVLGDHRIPAHVATSTGYFSAVEVQTVLSFLKILDNPYQDIPMAAVLKSAIVGLDNEELAEISLTEETHSFAEAALKQMAEAEEGKLYQFNKLYQKLRKRVSDTAIHLLIEMVLEETGYGDYVKALPAGGQRKANLDMLVEKAVAYEKTSYKGLFHFVRYIDQLQKYEVDYGEADVTCENEDVVRIMTIHKSKGLEFPVVFVSGMGKQFNEMDSREKMTVHPDMGLGLDEIKSNPRTKRKCMIRTEIADRIRRDNLGEELRVLYVALTRAKEKLILTGVVKSQDDLYKKHTGMVGDKVVLPFGQRCKARTYLDWVAPAVLSYPDKYGFTFVSPEDLILSETKTQAEKALSKEEMLTKIKTAPEDLVEKLREDFAYEYPYKQEEGRKSKYSVSELKHASMVEKYDRMEGEVEIPQFLLEERESYIPEFARESMCNSVPDFCDETGTETGKPVPDVNPGALRGTAFHRVMECMDFAKLLDYDISNSKALWKYLCEEMERMLDKKLLTAEMDQLIYRNSIIAFLQSPVSLRMAEAAKRGDLYTEKPFVMDYNGVLVQGIIDVFWLEGDKIVLMDYKTDSVKTPEELLTRYATQLQLYGQALGSVFGGRDGVKKETENLIYSFALDTTILVDDSTKSNIL